MYIIKRPGPRNTCKIQKLEVCRTRSSSFSEKEIEKLCRKNHIIINYSEAVNRNNISQVIYCKGVIRRTDNLLTLSALIWWYCISSFHSDLLSELTYSFFKKNTITSRKAFPPSNSLLSVKRSVSFGSLCWKQDGKRQHPWSRPWNNLAVYIAINSWGLAYSSWRTGFVPMDVNITIYFHLRNSNQ